MLQRDILLIAALALLLFSASANVMQWMGNGDLSKDMATLNDSYNSDRVAWSAQSQDFSAQIARLNSHSDALQAQIDGLRAQLTTQTSQRVAAENALAQAQSDITSREAMLAAQSARMQNLLANFTNLQNDINDSMKWFRDNSVIRADMNTNLDYIEPRVIEDCVDGGVLNLACVDHILQQRMATIRYRHDSSSNSSNRFQSLAETAARGSGDCKDYSLLLKAILNTVKEKNPGLHISAWEPGGLDSYIIFPKASLNPLGKDTYWYMPNSRGVDLGSLDDVHGYVVCYAINSSEGHCTVALSGVEVNDSSQIPLAMNGAAVFEPQDGQYYGRIGHEFSLCTASRWWDCSTTPNVIILIISDKDLYRIENGKWVGYGDYAKEVADVSAAGG